jgi:mono/diheme cytochrome c family protein
MPWYRTLARPILFPLTVLIVSTTLLAKPAHTQEETPALFTAAQAERGQAVYRAECAECHGRDLNDGDIAPLAGPAFLNTWATPDRSLADLYYITRSTM